MPTALHGAMTWTEVAAFAFESAIAAELALFAVFLLSSRQRRSPALYLLAALAAGLALMMSANLLIGVAGWAWLGDVVLCLDLLAPPTVYLYIRQIHHPPRLLRRLEALHVLPALAGMMLWESGALASMDVYVNTCWFGYLAISSYQFASHYRGYAPPARQGFLAMLLAALFAIGLLRLVIVLQVSSGAPFRNGVPYLLILAALFLSTCRILFVALRFPDLLSVPGSNLKYASSSIGESGLIDLDRRLADLLAQRKPYLDSEFSLAQLANLLGALPRHVSELINARYGMSFPAYMNLWRARTASAFLIAEPDKPIKSVMYESGFRSKSIFNREFQRHFAVTPGEFRRANVTTGSRQAEGEQISYMEGVSSWH